jgi:hypothetical protein
VNGAEQARGRGVARVWKSQSWERLAGEACQLYKGACFTLRGEAIAGLGKEATFSGFHCKGHSGCSYGGKEKQQE